MASTILFMCDYEGCMKALDERDVTQLHLCIHSAQLPDDLDPLDHFGLDLCEEHLDLVLARILVSATGSHQ